MFNFFANKNQEVERTEELIEKIQIQLRAVTEKRDKLNKSISDLNKRLEGLSKHLELIRSSKSPAEKRKIKKMKAQARKAQMSRGR